MRKISYSKFPLKVFSSQLNLKSSVTMAKVQVGCPWLETLLSSLLLPVRHWSQLYVCADAVCRSEDVDLEAEFEQNELNSAVYLISMAMQISNFAVNYKVCTWTCRMRGGERGGENSLVQEELMDRTGPLTITITTALPLLPVVLLQISA